MTKKSSFFNTFSAGLILSCLGANVFKCEASLQEEAGDGESRPAAASASLNAPNMLVSEITPDVPVLQPIKIPTVEELLGNTFWPELVSLQVTDAARKAKGTQGQSAFTGVINLPTLFEDYKNASIMSGEEKFLDILTRSGCDIKVVINSHEMELPEFRETLELSIRQWPVLKDCFFSLNQSVVLLRKRILADFILLQEAYEREISLIGQVKVLQTMNKSWEEQLGRRKKKLEELNQTLTQEKEDLAKENTLLKSQIFKNEQASAALIEENKRLKSQIDQLNKSSETVLDIPPTTKVTSNRKTGFWAWLRSLFIKDTGENKRLLDREN